MTRLQILIISAFLAVCINNASLLRAEPLDMYDSFNYPAGQTLAGQTPSFGVSGSWTGTPPYDQQFTIGSSSLVDPTGMLVSSGFDVTSGTYSDNKDVHCVLATPLGTPGTTAYFSWLIQPNGTIGAGYDNGHFGIALTNSSGLVNGDSLFIGRPGDADTNTPYDLEDLGGTNQDFTSVIPVSGQTVLMVLCADFTGGDDTFTLYVDPPGNGIEPTTPSAVKSDLDLGSINDIFIGGPGAFRVDELRVGSTYQSVTTQAVPEPATALLLFTAALALCAMRRRAAERPTCNARFTCGSTRNTGGGSCRLFPTELETPSTKSETKSKPERAMFQTFPT